MFRSPLICEYNSEIRESQLSNDDIAPDLRGFSNAFIMFGLLTYGRLIIDHFLNSGSFFLENFEKISREMATIHFLVYVALFWSFEMFIFLL